ncbi:serine hydrolase domain-containing protein [Paenibacillus sp. 22594]|uniref:serine hydrolase domain-containing protein n=1 Tax=Paenibacillus sp. 22594 TaxID=3453947 RepID=UPI003F8731C9
MSEHNRRRRVKQLSVSLLVVIMLLLAVPAYAAAEEQDLLPSGTPLSSLEGFIDNYESIYQRTAAAVSVAVVKDGKTILDKAYGFADIERQVAADTDTVFEWGSCTKLLVWTSVMQLVEQGKLNLETDIREYLPDGFLKKLKYEAPISLLNLMNHNAGWEDRGTDLYYFAEDDVPELGEALRGFEPRQVNQPGKVVAYSNYGAALAAYIVELQSGQPFYTYVQEHIFKVLGMEHTSIHPSQQDNPAVAAGRSKIQGYTTKLELIKKNRAYIGIYPAGGTIGTAKDAAKFVAALMPATGHNSPLFHSNVTLKKFLSPSLNYEGTDLPRIAHGFFEMNYAVPALEHGGNTLSFSSKFVLDPESGFGMVVMTNQQNEWNFTTGLVDKVFGAYLPAFYSGELPDSSQVAGEYITARRVVHGYMKILTFLDTEKITANNSSYLNINGQSLSQISPNTYVPVYQSGIILFVRDDQGAVIKMSRPFSDSFPITGISAQSTRISLIALGLGIAIIILSLLSGLFGWIVRRFKKEAKPPSPINKYHLWMNVAGIAFLVNTVILGYRSITYTTYSAIRIHLILNIAYVVLAAGYIVLLGLKLRRQKNGKLRTILYVLSGVSAMLFSALIIGWDLYF